MTIVSVPYTNEQVYRKVGFREMLNNPVNKFPGGYEIRDEVWDWCEANLKGKWCQWASIHPKGDPRQGREFEFEVKDSALLFKLRWGGQ